MSGKLHFEKSTEGLPFRIACATCDGTIAAALEDGSEAGDCSYVIGLLENLLETSPFKSSKRVRIEAMLIVRRLTQHVESHNFVDLKTSVLGQWCLQSLKSSIRELRILAG